MTRLARIVANLIAVALAPGGLSGPPGRLAAAAAEPAIADNSFLIEEAYNQEPGVVQHIQTLALTGPSRDDLAYSFTQEWPLGGQRHQLSATIPIERPAGEKAALGDVLLNLRVQFGGGEGEDLALAPRLSLILPTGSTGGGLGGGQAGVQTNVPLSWTAWRSAAVHANAGVTMLPSQVNYHLGGSVVAPITWPVQFLVESVWTLEEAATPTGDQELVAACTLNPGLRAAWNLGSAQIVPGFATPLTWTEETSGADLGLFFYLSVEHPFK